MRPMPAPGWGGWPPGLVANPVQTQPRPWEHLVANPVQRQPYPWEQQGMSKGDWYAQYPEQAKAYVQSREPPNLSRYPGGSQGGMRPMPVGISQVMHPGYRSPNLDAWMKREGYEIPRAQPDLSRLIPGENWGGGYNRPMQGGK